MIVMIRVVMPVETIVIVVRIIVIVFVLGLWAGEPADQRTTRPGDYGTVHFRIHACNLQHLPLFHLF